LPLRDHGEAIDTRVDQKAFEPTNANRSESFDVTLVIVDHPAPRRPIDAASAFCSCTLGLKRSDSRSRGKAVQGHIDQQCVSTCRRSSCCSFESLPLCATGIVDMQVRIDEPRKDGRFAEITDFAVLGRYLIRGDNSLDLLSVNQYGGRANSVGSDYPASYESLQTQNVSSL
jgi:hypothetical protein